MIRFEKNKQKGITLISLVVTMIVILIIAGVSVTTLTGENGIITRTIEVKNQTDIATKNEKTDLASIDDFISETITGIEVPQVIDANPGILEGSGTELDPFVINSIEDLVFFSYEVRSGNNTYEGQNVNLGINLDFKANKSYVDPFRDDYEIYGYNGDLKTLLTTGNGFIPIGETEGTVIEKNFQGTFNGCGHTISNLYINSNHLRTALFSINLGTIRNLGIINTRLYIDDQKYQGTGSTYIAAIAAQVKENSIVDNCFSSGEIISNCVSVGGIAGYCNGSITNCYNLCNITCSVNLKNETVVSKVGGIVGNMGSSGNISNSYNYGTINVTNEISSQYVGGIVGCRKSA